MKRTSGIWWKLFTAASAVGMLAAGPVAAQKTEILVYTALETDQIKAYEEGFSKANPDIAIKWVRDSTGVITAKLLAEKANPQADLVVGTSASSLAVFANEGMLQAYAPKGLDKISPQYRDPKNPPEWVGMDVYGAAICFNTVEAAKMGLPKPETWKDLTKPIYKGKIVMPNPASSGTGYLDVAGWIQMWGDADAWKYMDALHENIAQYTHSGSKPCRQAGAGEFPIGVSFEYRAVTTKKSGAPIDIIFPTEGLGWDLEASGIMKTTKKLEASRALMDWLATPAAMELFAKNFAVLAMPGMAKPLEFVPADYEKRLVKNDFAWSAKNRDKILAEWIKRYDGKSEPEVGISTASARRLARGALSRGAFAPPPQGARRRVQGSPNGSGGPFLKLDGISKSFGKFQALSGVALAIDRGELVTFLGPSGCGKTTLLRIIAGLETQDTGAIVQGGKDITRLPAIRRDYGIVFQSYALFPNLTIFDNVAYGLVNRRRGRDEIRARVAELLKLVGLPDSGAKYPGQLSGGQQQRIALARALATKPGLLLLDEPLSALDAIERVRLRGEIRALQQRLGVTTILVTHDQEEALSMADRIVVMNQGHIEQIGTPHEIYERPATPFAADFIGKINVLPAVAEGGGRFRVGGLSLDAARADITAGTHAKLYLRPEDIAVHANGAAATGPNAVGATITKVEFLGAFCMIGLAVDAADVPGLIANVPRQAVDAGGLSPGAAVGLTVSPAALRVLG